MSVRSGPGFARRAAGWLRRKAGVYYKPSWSQCGEDLIVAFVLDTLGVPLTALSGPRSTYQLRG